MSDLKIKTYPDKILKKNAIQITDINGKIQTLIDNIVDTMYCASGVGLAAPQVGESKRIIVVDVSEIEKKCSLMILLNPKIVYNEGEVVYEEGCLSVPQFKAEIERYERVFVKAINREGNPIEIEGTGLLSRALQHEIDHLNGLLFIDKLNPAERKLFEKTYRKCKIR